MSRLDRHVNAVRTKLFLGTLLKSLAWSLLGLGVVVLVNILVNRFVDPDWLRKHWVAFVGAGAGVSVAGAFAYTFWKRPTARQAAVAIDEKLGLKEKFSTALYVRPLNDPFAAAAVRDAEITADNVSLQKRFPVQFPRLMFLTLAVIVTALLAGRLLDPHPLFASDEGPAKKPQAGAEKMTPENKKLVAQAIAEIENTPALTAEDKVKVEAAKRTLEDLQHRPTHDTVAEQRSALKAMQDMQAIKDKVKELKDKAVQAKNETELFRSNSQAFDDSGPLGDVQKELAKGNFSAAAEKLGNVVDKFDKMKSEDQEKAAKQMDQLQQQLNKIAKDPKLQQQVANQLQKMGANPQQLQQLANAAQAAANGDKQAQQQVQQLANQIAQAANQQQGLTPQQQQQVNQQVQNMVKQMQGNANAQQAAQNMAGAAGALAKQMAAQAKANGQKGGAQQGGAQQAKAGGQQGGGQQGGGQQAGGQQAGGQQAGGQQAGGQQAGGQQAGGQQAGGQQAGGQQAGGQQAGGQQAGGQQAGGQQAGGQQAGGQQAGGQQAGGQQAGGQQAGGQQGGQNQGQGGQSMADAKQQMQQALRDLQDSADQAAEGNGQMADAQQGGQGQGGDDGQGQQQAGQGNGGQAPWDKNNPNQHGAGSGGGGISDGGPRPKGSETPVAFQKELAPSQADEKGKFNTVRWVKALSEKGSSHIEASGVVEQAEKDSADEVDQDRITRSEQAVVKRYFDDLKNSQSAAPAGDAKGDAKPQK